MISAKDLMVGNYLKWKDNGSIFELTIDIFCEKNFQNHLSNGDFEPIPLSEEILLKCGFQKYSHTVNANYLNSVSFFYQKLELWWFSSAPIRGIDFPFIPLGGKDIKIEYLHELQQLYKILTKQELEIKL